MFVEKGTPAERTFKLASLNYDQLAVALEGMELVSGSAASVTLEEVQGFNTHDNSRGVYRPLLRMDPLTVLVCASQGRWITLISALDNGESGGCVKLNRAIQQGRESSGRLLRPSFITEVLGLERGIQGKVVFRDDSSTLYIVKEDLLQPPTRLPARPNRLTQITATNVLDQIIGR